MDPKRCCLLTSVKLWMVCIALVSVPDNRVMASALDAGFIQLDYAYSTLSNDNVDWQDASIRSYLEITRRDHLDAEISRQRHFGDSGILYGLRYLRVLNERWYGSLHFATSDGGFFLPDHRLDLSVSRKWLTRKQLISSLSYMYYQSKDGHTDHAPQLSVLYYFPQPWLLEVGVRRNLSDPGAIVAWRQFVAVTYGRNKERYLIFQYDAGKEAYQLISSDALVSDFASREMSFTWRQWLSKTMGFNLTASGYENPSYARSGLRAGLFCEF